MSAAAPRLSFWDLVPADMVEHHIARFWRLVDRNCEPEDCWPFLGGCTEKGYGRFKIGGRLLNAARVAYEIANQTRIPWVIRPRQGRPYRPEILHSCDYPACCNPAHISLGTHSKNVREMYERGRR